MPPTEEIDIHDVMDQVTTQLFEELSSPHLDLMIQIWERIRETAPRDAYGQQVAHYVRTLHEVEHGEEGGGDEL